MDPITNYPVLRVSDNRRFLQLKSGAPFLYLADPDYEAIAAREAKAIREEGEGRPRNNTPGALYYGMNVPMAPLAIRGVLWYQGEANFGRGFQYGRLFPL